MATDVSISERPVAAVTAASRGVGEGIAREFSVRGYRMRHAADDGSGSASPAPPLPML